MIIGQRSQVVLILTDMLVLVSASVTDKHAFIGLSCKSPWIGANQLPKDFGYPEHEERDILYTSYLRSEALHLRVQ